MNSSFQICNLRLLATCNAGVLRARARAHPLVPCLHVVLVLALRLDSVIVHPAACYVKKT